MEIKKEIEGDIKMEGFSEFLPIDPQETTNSSGDGQKTSQSVTVVTPQAMPPELEAVINGNMGLAAVNNSRGALPNHTNLPLVSTNANSGVDGNVTNHTNSNHTTMEPPRRSSVSSTTTPRKRNRSASSSTAAATSGGATSTALTTAASAAAAMAQDSLEHLYLEEIKKKNIILVEQGEINRKRLRLEERKVKLMEDFFPKYLSLQQDILKKLDNLNNSTPESFNIRIED